ncbi:hypothetical protein BGZ58_004516 [Dissophora ornata]|nr:hypothetical protein BGZ58_004516 [Dissophora ornata]
MPKKSGLIQRPVGLNPDLEESALQKLKRPGLYAMAKILKQEHDTECTEDGSDEDEDIEDDGKVEAEVEVEDDTTRISRSDGQDVEAIQVPQNDIPKIAMR